MDVCQEVGGAYRGRYHGTHAAGQPYLGETRGFLIIAAANDAPAAPSCFSSLGIFFFFFFFHQKSEQSDSGFFSSSSEVWIFVVYIFENYFNLFICSFWLIKFSLHGGLPSNKVDVIFFQSSLIFNHRCMKIGFLVKFNFPTAI